MRIIILLILAVCISGCSAGNEPTTTEEEMKTRCLDGVIYYKDFRIMSPKFNKNGTIATCDN